MAIMDKSNWKLDEDGAAISSVSEIWIPWLGVALEIWIEMETNQEWWTSRQELALIEFLGLNDSTRENLKSELIDVYSIELKKGRIERMEYAEVLHSINWSKSHICIPQHYESANNYVLLLPETNCELVDSKYTLELELLFTNGKIELVQEMSGLWNRIEWFEYYIKREKKLN